MGNCPIVGQGPTLLKKEKILRCNKAGEEVKQPVSCFVAHTLRLSAILLPAPATPTTATTGGEVSTERLQESTDFLKNKE